MARKAESAVNPKGYNWTEKRKQAAHKALLLQWNRVEIQKKATLKVDYLPDGTAVCLTIGRVNKSYSHKMV